MAMSFARLGYVRGDAFMTGAIILIVATVVLFIFFPVTTIFIKVLFDRAGAFAPLQIFAIATGFGTGRVFMNSVFLALCVGVSSTFFGLVFALYTVRSMSRYRNVIKIFSILPIITPPFVIGLALILIFGRSGSINDILDILFGAGGLFIPEGGEPLFRRSQCGQKTTRFRVHLDKTFQRAVHQIEVHKTRSLRNPSRCLSGTRRS